MKIFTFKKLSFGLLVGLLGLSNVVSAAAPPAPTFATPVVVYDDIKVQGNVGLASENAAGNLDVNGVITNTAGTLTLQDTTNVQGSLTITGGSLILGTAEITTLNSGTDILINTDAKVKGELAVESSVSYEGFGVGTVNFSAVKLWGSDNYLRLGTPGTTKDNFNYTNSLAAQQLWASGTVYADTARVNTIYSYGTIVTVNDILQVNGNTSALTALKVTTGGGLGMYGGTGGAEIGLRSADETRGWNIGTDDSINNSGVMGTIAPLEQTLYFNQITNSNRYSHRMALDGSGNLRVYGNIRSINGSIGSFNFHESTDLESVPSGGYKTESVSCSGGETLISCAGYQDGSGYKYKGTYSSGNTCTAASVSDGSRSKLRVQAICFTPDGST